MKAPQIIYLVLVGIQLLMTAHKHGEMKMDKHNIWTTILNAIFASLLLYWGGFFS